jgi:DNA-binding SARP family transcriptional activator
VRFGVLGPLRVEVGGRVEPIASSRQRAVLTLLLMSANQTVPTARLIDSVWGAHPAGSVQNMVHTYVWRLRTLLDEDGDRRLVTGTGGYLLRVEPGELDSAVFGQAVRDGRAALAAGRPADAAALLGPALELWRGEPFADVTLHGGDQEAERERLAELRLTALEERGEAELSLGRHEALIGRLRTLADEHPLRERFTAQLMLACHRAGRTGDALAAFERARAVLAAELGLDPGRGLLDLRQRILRADPALAGTPAARPPAARAVPRQLPAVAGQFAGRAAQLAALDALLAGPAEHGAAAVISAIDGTAGIGKTSLALHWGHRNLAAFPDGQLYVNLRGFAHDNRPLDPAEAVRGLLDALGVPPERVPGGLTAQAALYRSMVADKRMLVVLDNARDADQVRPLLPGSPACTVLVTSRIPLTGLVVAEGARPLTLDLLTAEESRDLLVQRLGPRRVAAQRAAADALVGLCARLPLALGIVAARAQANPGLGLDALAERLRHVRGRLDALYVGDASTDPRAVFSWSYQQLTAPAARLFRLAGLHPGPDFTAQACASLAGLTPDRVRPLLDELTTANLISEPVPGRHACHDLLRAYADELAREHDAQADRQAAVHRTLDYYLHTAHAAARLATPARSPIPLDPARPDARPAGFEDEQRALAWLEAQRPVLLAAADQALSEGFERHACLLPWVLANFLDQRGYWHDYFAAQSVSLAAARKLDDLPEQARALRFLGSAHARLGAHDDAHENLRQALDLHVELDDTLGRAHTELALGSVYNRQGRHRDSLGHVRRALALYEEAGHRSGQADTLNALGWLHSQLDDHDQALIHCRRALDLHRQLGDRFGQAHTADSLGYAHHRLGRYPEALACYHDALGLYRQIGDPYSQATTLGRIGDTYAESGDAASARQSWAQGAQMLEELGHPDAEGMRAKLREH